MDDTGFDSCMGQEIFLFFQCVQTACWAHPASCFSEYQTSFLRLKWLKGEANHLSPSKGRFTYTMPFRYGFRLCLSHLIYTVWPCLIHTHHAVPLPCHEYAFLKPISPGSRQGMCELASASRGGMLATCQCSAYSCYHAEFQDSCYQKHTDLRCRWPV
jgi:hypothetical protein